MTLDEVAVATSSSLSVVGASAGAEEEGVVAEVDERLRFLAEPDAASAAVAAGIFRDC